MKHVERLGNEYAMNWTRPPLPAEHQAALSNAWQVGFRQAREMCAGLIEGFHNPKTAGLAILIRAIGEGTVESHEEGEAK